MCGIIGGNNPKWNYEKALQTIIHRGPDGNRVERFSDLTMAFCRLAIQDLSELAMQPMSSPDNKIHIVYNGEIYGYQELKNELSVKYDFKTTSDTEVILYAYAEYGEAFIDKVDGIFAMAIYDENRHQIYVYRDRIGVKPLYYYYDGSNFAFSSELKGLERLIPDKLEIDKTALYDYLFYKYIPEPKSLYKNIYKLRPATVLVFNTYTKKIDEKKRYWNLNVNTGIKRERKKEDIATELRHLIKKSVEEQLIADVPVGTFLSGGVDSSIITYETKKIRQNIKAFSIGFKETQFDESERAALFCEKEDIKLINKILVNRDVGKIKNMLPQWYDEPFGDISAYPTYLVSKLARTECTVVLTGDGGDELFGGYELYKNVFMRGDKLKPTDIWYQHAKPAKAVEDFRIKWGISKDYNPYWHFEEFYIEDMPILTRMRYLDFMTYLPEDILTKVDRASMAVSLEARVPFLARHIVEFAFSLSQEEYFSNNELKGCVKDAYKDIIPNEILFGVKIGFGVPDNYFWKEKHEQNIYAGILKTQWSHLDKA